MALASNCSTPIPYFLEMPLWELRNNIDDNNELIADREAAREESRKKRKKK